MRRVWLALLGGPFAWFTLLSVAFYVVPGAHEHGREGTLRILHAAAAIITLACGALAIRELRAGAGDTSDVIVQRHRFLSIGAITASALSFLLVVGMAITVFMLAPGTEP